MFEFEWNFPFFSKKPFNKSLEDSIKSKLGTANKVVNTYKNDDGTKVTETIYKGEGFEYTSTSYEVEDNPLMKELVELQGQLDKAVDNEDYTNAVNIKNKIEELKKQINKK